MPAHQAWAYLARGAAPVRLAPPWEDITFAEPPPPLAVGQRLVSSGAGQTGTRRVLTCAEVDEGRSYRMTQVSGPFETWTQTRTLLPSEDEGCVLEDVIEYEAPAGADPEKVKLRLERGHGWRHALLKSDLALLRKQVGKRLVVALTGASGLVGTALRPLLEALGHEVRPVGRSSTGEPTTAVLAGADAVVNLAGASIADSRWSEERKRLLATSRVDYTARLVHGLRQAPSAPHVLVSGSAIGVYGDRRDDWVTEESEPGRRSPVGAGYLAGLCLDWEAQALAAAELGTRVVLLRSGLVLSPRGGVLGKLLPVYKLGAGGPTGSGGAWMSWVSIEDELRAIHHALVTPSVKGPLNAVAPNPVTGLDFATTLGRVLSRPAVLPLPAFALRVMFGEMADGALLASQRVKPAVLEAVGSTFLHPELEQALRALLGRDGGA